MSDYIAFLHGGIERPTQRPLDDGSALANQCLSKLRKIENQEQFPLKLLFLLISAGYLGGEDHLDEVKARQLIAGVRRAFFEAGHRDIPLIGSSVAAVFFDCIEGENKGRSQIYEEGALLVCLASRMLDVSVSVATNVSNEPEAAVQTLIDGLDIEHTLNEYPRALPNRVLLTFFPGTGTTGKAANNSTDKLHTLLLERLNYQMPIVGGVSSANDRSRKKRGLQLVNQQTFTDALAACLIRSGLPVATSMAQGLEPLTEINPILHVEEILDEEYITRFREGLPEEIFKDFAQPVLLRDCSPQSAVVRAKWLPDSNPNRVQILREVRRFLSLEATTPIPKKMYQDTLAAHDLSLKRAKIKSPAGCLSFKCSGHLDYQDELKLDLPRGIGKMKKQFNIPHYVGGFYDGEIATDAAGAFTCGGWSIAALIFGDEISERTAVQWGFSTLATHGPALTATFDLKEAFKQSLELVYDLGFPGAMLCLLIRDHNPDLAPEQSKRIVVATSAKGTRFNQVLQLIEREGGHAEVALEAVSDRAPFMSHSGPPLRDARDLFREAGVINEYVLPLRDSANQVFALLRVDVGSQGEEKIHDAVKGVLNSIAAIVGAAINRISSWQENRIVLKLDQTLQRSMSANTQKEGLQQFIRGSLDAFGLSNGQIRLVNPAHDSLILEAGEGAYFEAAKLRRSEVSFENWSPSCEAFVRDATTIINDAPNNIAHKRLSGLYADDSVMTPALKGLGSYANVPFKSENGERLGTISLLSNSRWFFNSYHERALAALGRRVSFLIDHLRTKEGTRRAIQETDKVREREKTATRNLNFIRSISRKFDLVSDTDSLRPNDICNLLEFATQSLCGLVGAQAGAFYLWDEDQQQFILRGQFGWKDENWLHIARYRRTDDWIGTKGLADKPRYVADLYQYYRDQRYSEPGGRHAKQIFGQALSPDSTVEAIAAPVKLAGTQVGVLTLYGVPRPQGLLPSQFYTTDIWLLEEAVNRFGGLIGVLLDHQAALEEERAADRRNTLLKTFAGQRRRDSFEGTVGDALIQTFRASRIDFYRPSEDRKTNHFTFFLRMPKDAPATGVSQSDDEFVMKAVERTNLVTRRCILPRTEMVEPELAVTDGMIERAALPLVTRGNVSLVIDFHWDARTLSDLEPFHYFTVNELEALGPHLGSLYEKHIGILESDLAQELREQSQLVAHTFGVMMAQCGHKVESLLRRLNAKVKALATARPEEQLELIEALHVQIDTERRWLDRCKTAAGKAGSKKRNSHLLSIVDAAISESLIKESNDRVHNQINVAKNLSVFANDDAIREVFVNVITNAVEAMHDGGSLKIKSYPSTRDDEFKKDVKWFEDWEMRNLRKATVRKSNYETSEDNVAVVFEDNGVGMDLDQLAQLGKDHTTKQGHQGLGTVICQAVMDSQNGLIGWDSTLGQSTTVVIALPSRQMEE
jgi:signal transduction histidine kinase